MPRYPVNEKLSISDCPTEERNLRLTDHNLAIKLTDTQILEFFLLADMQFYLLLTYFNVFNVNRLRDILFYIG